MSKIREEGYYWVKYCGTWRIAKCNPGYYWEIVSLDDSMPNLNNLDYEDDEFEEIKESRILTPEESVVCPICENPFNIYTDEVG